MVEGVFDRRRLPCSPAEMERQDQEVYSVDGLCGVASATEHLQKAFRCVGPSSVISSDYVVGGLIFLSALGDPETEIKGEIPFLWPGTFPEADKECPRHDISPFCKTG